MASQPPGLQQSIRFGEDFTLDVRPRRLRRGVHVLKLERIPLEILVLLLEHPGEVVTRERIVARVWGNDIFFDTENSVRGAIRKIRQVLKDDPVHPRFIQTVTGQGYRLIAPVMAAKEDCSDGGSQARTPTVPTIGRELVSELDGWLEARRLRVVEEDNGARNAEERGHAEDAPKRANQRTRRWLFTRAMVLLAVSCLLLLIAILGWRRNSGMSQQFQRQAVLAVLPFENVSRDPEQEFFSDGLTEEMIAQVGKLNRDRLAVIARSSVEKYKGTRLAAKQIGKELSADYLLQGSARRWADHVRITVQLIQAQDQTDLWTESYDRELKDVLAVQDSVVRSIAGQIHIALTEEQETRFASPRQIKPGTYDAYLKGRYLWNKRTGESMQKAEQYFQQAIDSDPTYAEAYSGLADCNSGLAWHGFKSPADALPRAYAAARKAIEINPRSAQAHASLGLVLSHRWEWSEAEIEFRRALDLDSQYANAHHWYGDYLSMKGRHEEAIAEARRALEIDPLNLMISSWVGLRYYLARDYSSAIEQNRNSVELDSNFAAAHLLLGEDFIQAGSQSDSMRELKRAANLSGNSPLYTAQVAVAFAAAGRKQDALRLAHELERISTKRYVSPYGLAQIYAELHEKENTFKWLHVAYDDHAVWMGYLAVDPVFDPYHSDQRFQDLLGRVGLL
jgi:TolB-like protein/DNA-binding winged helix-turn-helix (wHTH) protein/Tfp pilus assembly protein PilF